MIPSRKDDWLSGRGIATEEGAFPRGLKEGLGRYGAGVGRHVMAAPWPRVHLYRSLGPVTKESRRRCLPLSRSDLGAGASQCRSPAAVPGKPLGTRSGGKSEGRGGRGQSPRLRRGDRTGVGGGSGAGAGKGGVWQSPGNSPEILHGGPRGRRLKRFLEEGVPRLGGCWPEEVLGGRPFGKAAVNGPR